MLQPRDKGMLATTLRYPYEVRQDGEIFGEISDPRLPAEMLDIAQEIINRMSGHFEPDTFTDRYEEAVVGMLKAKQAGQTFTVPEPAAPANVVNIMDALKKSLEASGGDGAVRRPRAPSKKAEDAPAARKPRASRLPRSPRHARRRADSGRRRCLSPTIRSKARPSSSSAASRA